MEKKLYMLTEAQKRVLTMHEINSGGAICNIGGSARIKGKVSVRVLKKALESLVESNDSFHIRILCKQNFYQYFEKKSKVNIDFVDFSYKTNPMETYQQWESEEMRREFILEENPLYYICIFKLSESQYGYFIKLHHIIADGWSMQLISERIRDAYVKILKKEEMDVQTYPFQQYVEKNDYYQSKEYIRDKNYWNTQFNDMPEQLMLPIDYLEHTEGKRISFVLDEEEEVLIRNFCKEVRVTLHTAMMLLLAIYFIKVDGTNDIVIGSPTLGRRTRTERKIIGMFVSSLPIRYQVNREDTLAIMAQKMSNKIKESFKHQMYPLNHLLKDLNLNADGRYKLFDICVNYYNTYLADCLVDMEVEYHEAYNGYQEYALQMIVREWSNDCKIQLDFDYKISRFKEKEINAIYQGLRILIKMLSKPNEYCLKDICLLNKEEYQKLVIDYNKTSKKWNSSQTLWDSFEEQVLQHPDKVAISCGNSQITYDELRMCVLGIEQQLGENFATNKDNKIIGIYMTHSIEAIAMFLYAAKVNVTYVPIDIDSPFERINQILNSACIDVIITNKRGVEWGSYKGKICILEKFRYYIQYGNSAQNFKRTNEHIYTIFTSGSTGTPKGVLVKESSLINYLNWAKENYEIKESDTFALFTSFAFDLTVTTIFLPLITGASIRVYNPNKGLALETIINEDVCTVIKLTPSHLSILEHYIIEQTKIHTLIVGGENLKVSSVEAIKKKLDVQIYNEYGPTECTIGCMSYLYKHKEVKREINSSVPIGKPIANVQIYLLDKDYQPVPKYTVGEIYVGGSCLATGYLHEKELTYEKFRFIPTIDGKLLYKTGDLAKFIDDNTLVFCGRKDNQLKIRGIRIELGEIEYCLSQYGKFKQFALKVHHWGKTDLLCLYYTANKPESDSEIRHYLETKLPSYMIPSYYVYVETMPLTPNGKIDINRLSLPIMEKKYKKSTVIGIAEQLLVQGAEEVFGHRMNIGDNFYEAGGDSIKAIQLSYKMREKGYLLKISDIFEKPCLADMALLLARHDENKNNKENLSGELSLTPILSWFFTQNLDKSSFYEVIELELKRGIKYSELQEIITQLFVKHDVFRIINKNNRLFYVEKEVPIIEEEWIESVSNVEEIIREQKERLGQELNISSGKIFNAKLLHKNDGDILIIAIHHICIDGVSWRILLNEIDLQLSAQERVQKNSNENSFMSYASLLKGKKKSIKVPDECELIQIQEQDITYIYEVYFSKEDIGEMFGIANETYNTEPFEILLAAITKTMDEELNTQYRIIELESHGRLEDEYSDILHTVGWFTVLYPYYIEFDFLNLYDLLIKTKEHYRRQKSQISAYAVSHDYCRLKKRPFLKFNYLGEINTEYNNFVLNPNIVYKGKCTNALEIDCFRIDGGLKVIAKGDVRLLEKNKISDFVERFRLNLQKIIQHCLDNAKQFTPSDFETVDLTYEDIQVLFE